jgi:hypothetical protein
MDRAALADEAAAELLEDPVRLHEDLPEPVRVVGIVRTVNLVLVETDRFGNFVRFSMDSHMQAQLVHFIHEPAVERGCRLRFERQSGNAAVADLQDQLVIDKVEVDLERPAAVRDG